MIWLETVVVLLIVAGAAVWLALYFRRRKKAAESSSCGGECDSCPFTGGDCSAPDLYEQYRREQQNVDNKSDEA